MSNVLVTILKFIGYFLTMSPTMFAEALHSSADIVNQILLYAGIKKSKNKRSKQHPWGTGAMQYLFNFISALGIFILGCVLNLWHVGYKVFNPDPSEDRWLWLNIVILVLSFIIEGYSCLFSLKSIWKEKGREKLISFFKRTQDPTLVAIFLEDSTALIGIIVALIGVTLSQVFHSHFFDLMSSTIIGLMMGLVSIFLAITNALFLIGKSVDSDKEDEYKEFIESLDSVEKVIEIRTEVLSPGKVHLSIKVELHPTFIVNIDQLKRDADEIRSGEPIMKILMDVADRSVRATGREIGALERKIRTEFSEIVSIDFEQN
jgi:cation diffusion facilitator family transporter